MNRSCFLACAPSSHAAQPLGHAYSALCRIRVVLDVVLLGLARRSLSPLLFAASFWSRVVLSLVVPDCLTRDEELRCAAAALGKIVTLEIQQRD